MNTTEAQRRDAINYSAGQVVEFHKKAKGGFKSGEQWEVATSNTGQVVVVKDGQAKFLPVAQANTFDLYTREQLPLSVGDTVRVTKNFQSGGAKFRNNELVTVKETEGGNLSTTDGRQLSNIGVTQLHLDQGICVTSHAAQGKTVDNVIVSAPVAAFSQVNQAQLYVSMSRARHAMHLFTDSKAALREAVTKTSERVSALSLLSRAVTKAIGIDLQRRAAMHQAQRGVDMARGWER